jgi:DNA-binding CsgD family transcriptional regulator
MDGHCDGLRAVLTACAEQVDAECCVAMPLHAREHHLPHSVVSRRGDEEILARALVGYMRLFSEALDPAVRRHLQQQQALCGETEALLERRNNLAGSGLARLAGARLALVLLGERGRESAALAALRPSSMAPFTAADLRHLQTLGREGLLAAVDFPQPAAAVPGCEAALIGALGCILPLAGAAFDGRGRLLWISDRAARWLGIAATRLASTVFTAGDRSRLEALRAAVRRCSNGRRRKPDRLSCAALEADGMRLQIRRARRGSVGERLTLVLAEQAGNGSSADRSRESLLGRGCTPREAEVVELAAWGLTLDQIADQIGVRYSTAHTHLKRAYRKLGVSSRAALASLYYTGGRARP